MTDKQADAGADNLPPLPEPKYVADDLADIYTAEQVRQAQREAVEADRRRFAEQVRKLNELWAQQTERIAALGRAIATSEAELAALRAEVREWLCIDCKAVYPGPPQAGTMCVMCPKCQGSCGPRGFMERRALQKEIADLRAELAIRGAAQWRITKQNSVSNSSSNCTSEVAAQALDMVNKLLTIIAYAYQIAGAHNAPEHILDVLANPTDATSEQIEAMLPYQPDQALGAGNRTASIDTGEFRELLQEYWRCMGSGSANKVTAKIIAHIDAKLAAARRDALEEAAKICDETWVEPGDMQVARCTEAAESIRKLATAPAPRKEETNDRT